MLSYAEADGERWGPLHPLAAIGQEVQGPRAWHLVTSLLGMIVLKTELKSKKSSLAIGFLKLHVEGCRNGVVDLTPDLSPEKDL